MYTKLEFILEENEDHIFHLLRGKLMIAACRKATCEIQASYLLHFVTKTSWLTRSVLILLAFPQECTKTDAV